MKSYIYLLLITLSIILISCSSDEPLYDNSNQNWMAFVSRNDGSNKVSIYQETDGTILYDDIYQQINNKTLPGKVEKIAVYGDNIYLLIPSAFKIIALNRWNYQEKGIIDFTSLALEPNDICFMNATNAYVVHTKTNQVSLVDIKYFTPAKQIKVGSAPVSIVTSGYYVVTANSKSNNLSIIDSRNNSKLMDFPVSDYPYYVDVNSYGNVTAVCLGNGKLDTTIAKTPAYIYQIDMSTKTAKYSGEIKYSVLKSIDQIPNGLAVTDKDIAFISTNEGLFLFNTKVPNGTVLVNKVAHRGLTFNKNRSELVLLKNIDGILSGYTGSNSNGKASGNIFVPSDLITLLPM